MILSEPSQRHPSHAVPPECVTENSNVSQPSTMKPLEAIRCTQAGCPCECFAPGKQSLRYCDTCSHGWVAHALDKLGTNHVMNLGLHVEVVQPNIVFDIASLMLYGAHATPVRLKILLDRLFSVLQHEEVLQVLHGFGWTYEDYARGYILQDSSGRVLDKWCVATRDEEMVVLQQFLRFGETKAIAQEIILQDTKDRHEVLVKQNTRAESDIKKFIERSNLSMQNYIKSYESTRQLFGSRPVPFIPPPGTRIMSTPLISPSYTPARDVRSLPVPQTSTTSTTPMVTPPINRIQILQPFDGRKEHTTPALGLSPGGLDKSVVAVAAVATRRSPVCESPKNLSTTPSTISSAAASPSHQVIQPQLPKHVGLDEVDGSDAYNSGSDDDGEILDYSNKDNPDSPSDPDKKNKQHMRKSSNPIKRQWTPSANFGSTFVGPNGKKRVLCTACNKTFCDKGALKIHYSAVHLKEMHKCTVEGCNMMFSSRRSRNRHSANPNPKLHMPQKRKDDLDQTDEMDLSSTSSSGRITPVVPTPALVVSSSTPILTNPPQALPIIETPRMPRPESSFFIEMSAQFPFISPPEKRIKLEDDQPTDLSQVSRITQPDDEPCDLSKKYDGELKLEIDLDAASDEKEDLKFDDEVDSEESGTRNDTGVRGGKRRKTAVPTRCAQSGDHHIASDDNSDDKDNKCGPLPKVVYTIGKIVEMKTSINLAHGVPEMSLNNSHSESQNQSANEISITSDSSSCSGTEKAPEGNGAKHFPKIASLLWSGGVNMEVVNAMDAAEESKTCNTSKSPKDDICINEERKDEIEDNNDDDDYSSGRESCEEYVDALQDYPPDIYVDKENSLKCKICGKIFQNSFTVKVHFQNVHLKLLHSCTVDGCFATFPSKRSRDRHSANVNLHRRLLMGESGNEQEMDDALRGNILAKLYGHDLVGAGMVSTNSVRKPLNGESEHRVNISINNNNEQEVQKTPVPTNEPLKITIQQVVNGHASKPGSAGSEHLSDSDGSEAGDKEDSELHKIPCSVCGEKFSNPLVLQEHVALTHPDLNLMTFDPVVLRKSVSPRRNRSRQKVRNGMITRKSSAC